MGEFYNQLKITFMRKIKGHVWLPHWKTAIRDLSSHVKIRAFFNNFY